MIAKLRQGSCGVATLATDIGVTPRTVQRWLNERHSAICSAGAASRTRYALVRPLRGRVERHPLFQVNSYGQVEEVGQLVPIRPGGTLCSFHKLGWPADKASLDGWWEGLPYPLYDMQPQGFLGRTFARKYHADLDVAPDPRNWNDEDVLHILARVGWDTSGNLILGERALERWQKDLIAPEPGIAETDHVPAYLQMAQDVASLGVAGRSAAGEFPKFTAVRILPGSATEHVIVKFSGEAQPGATQRWSDLLVCEHLAAIHVAHLPGVTSARTRILQGKSRTFLESERFDRVGRYGRLPLVSLSAIDGHLLGCGTDDWRVPARRLMQLKYLSPDDFNVVLLLWWFGKLIANADMHMGNLSFIPANGLFRIAPSYDMLPMAYAPLPGGEVPEVIPNFALPVPAEREEWLKACACAISFWEQAANDLRISDQFRTHCHANAQTLADLRHRFSG